MSIYKKKIFLNINNNIFLKKNKGDINRKVKKIQLTRNY